MTVITELEAAIAGAEQADELVRLFEDLLITGKVEAATDIAKDLRDSRKSVEGDFHQSYRSAIQTAREALG